MAKKKPKYDLAYSGVLNAMRVYPFLVALCVIGLTVVGLGVGYVREPTYESSSELLVSNLSISDPSAVPGAVGASLSLASVYSRLIDATDVRNEVAEQTGGGPDASVSATQIVETPLIQITAESESEEAAITYANAGGAALANYVNNLQSPGGNIAPIARRYREAQLDLREKEDAYDRQVERAGPSPTDAERAVINDADSEVALARLERDALAAIYARGENVRISQPTVQVFRIATTASSDRAETMQITGAIGFAAGLALAAAFSVFLAGRLMEGEETS